MFAPGWPGIEARWTSSAKDGIGTALGSESRIWYALSHGVINEVYYPRIDQACTRDLPFIVTDGEDFFSEEKRDTETTTELVEAGVPLFRVTNRYRAGRYVLVKEVFADPGRDCLVQRITLEKWSPGLRLHVFLAPHIANRGMGNTAWVGDYKGTPMLIAERDGVTMALGCSTGWAGRAVGFVGQSDGWRDLRAAKRMTWFHERAENGNVAMTGEVGLRGGYHLVWPQDLVETGGGDHQSGCPGPGALRFAGCGRSPRSRHHQSDRCLVETGSAWWSSLVPLQWGRLWGA